MFPFVDALAHAVFDGLSTLMRRNSRIGIDARRRCDLRSITNVGEAREGERRWTLLRDRVKIERPRCVTRNIHK